MQSDERTSEGRSQLEIAQRGIRERPCVLRGSWDPVGLRVQSKGTLPTRGTGPRPLYHLALRRVPPGICEHLRTPTASENMCQFPDRPLEKEGNGKQK